MTPAQIKNHLVIIVKCMIENPSFESQTKETLTTKSSQFGSECVLDEKVLNALVTKTHLIQYLQNFSDVQHKNSVTRKVGLKKARVTGITKLEDANHAGGSDSSKCTLSTLQLMFWSNH